MPASINEQSIKKVDRTKILYSSENPKALIKQSLKEIFRVFSVRASGHYIRWIKSLAIFYFVVCNAYIT